MSEHLELRNSQEIRDWIDSNNYDVIDLDQEAPRFFQPKFTMTPGPMQIFGVQHTYLKDDEQPLVSVQRSFMAMSAEDALRAEPGSVGGLHYMGRLLRRGRGRTW